MIRHYYYGFLCREGAQPSTHNCRGVEYINNPVISGDLLLLVRITEAALDGMAVHCTLSSSWTQVQPWKPFDYGVEI